MTECSLFKLLVTELIGGPQNCSGHMLRSQLNVTAVRIAYNVYMFKKVTKPVETWIFFNTSLATVKLYPAIDSCSERSANRLLHAALFGRARKSTACAASALSRNTFETAVKLKDQGRATEAK